MKRLFIRLIKLYQSIPGDFHNHCRFYPTCSNYAIEALETHGVIRGMGYTVKRLFRCNPFNKKCGIDLVPPKKK